MKKLIVLEGYSSTLKSSVTKRIAELVEDITVLPDINREFLDAINGMTAEKEQLNFFKEIPEVLQIAHRYTLCKALTQAHGLYIVDRLPTDHIFFPNNKHIIEESGASGEEGTTELLYKGGVDLQKLKDMQDEWLSTFDKVVIVLMLNDDKEFVESTFLTDPQRKAIGVYGYEVDQEQYRKHIGNFVKPQLELHIVEGTYERKEIEQTIDIFARDIIATLTSAK